MPVVWGAFPKRAFALPLLFLLISGSLFAFGALAGWTHAGAQPQGAHNATVTEISLARQLMSGMAQEAEHLLHANGTQALDMLSAGQRLLEEIQQLGPVIEQAAEALMPEAVQVGLRHASGQH